MTRQYTPLSRFKSPRYPFLRFGTDRNPKNPASVSDNYAVMAAEWAQIDDIMGGTPALIASKRLPQHENESLTNYEQRLQRSAFYNVFSLTLDRLVGLPFSKSITFQDNLSPPYSEYFENIDTFGNDINVFARNWFKSAYAKGFSHALLEIPEPINGTAQTIADDAAQNRRPYWKLLDPEQVIDVVVDNSSGKEEIVQLRYVEWVRVKVGYTEELQERINVLTQTESLYYSLVRKEWIPSNPVPNTRGMIPFVTYYVDREDVLLGKPPLQELGYKNLLHWSVESELDNTRRYAGFPVATATGLTEEEMNLAKKSIIVAPGKLWTSTNKDAKFMYLEHSGSAIGATVESIKMLEAQMEAYGGQFLEKTNVTATQRIMDGNETTTPLRDAVLRFNDSLNTIIGYTADAVNRDDAPIAFVNDELTMPITPTELESLKFARDNGAISNREYVQELQKAGLLNSLDLDTITETTNDDDNNPD